jgi:thiol-disulfide isomerase/thioredoxin
MRKSLVLVVWILATVGVLAFDAEAPASTAPGLVSFSPTSTYRVEVDGAEIRTAETFMGEPGLLILGCSLRFPVLVCPSDQSIRYIPQENVIRDNEGNVSMKGTPTDPISNFQTSGQQIIFSAEGRKVRLSPKPALVGPQTLDKIIAHNPDYENRIKNYKPNEEAVAYLSKYANKTEVQIYFGSWCSVCEAWVPRLVKSLQTANNPMLQTQFVALPKNFSTDAVSKSKGINGVPTIILVQNGKEVVRLSGRPETGTIEEAIVRLLKTASP